MEPENVAFALSQMGLNYVVLTSVDRDDIPDGGASHFAKTIHRIREMSPGMLIEVLVPDFQNDVDSIRAVVEASPDVIAHNIETTFFLTDTVEGPTGRVLAVAIGPEDREETQQEDVHKVVDNGGTRAKGKRR